MENKSENDTVTGIYNRAELDLQVENIDDADENRKSVQLTMD